MKPVPVALLLLLATTVAPAQSVAANGDIYKASVLRFQSQSMEWRNSFAKIRPEELPVLYAEGKLVDQNKDNMVQNLDMSSTLSVRVLKTHRLSDEINLLETIHELLFNLQQVNVALLNLKVKDNASMAKIAGWSKSLTDLANGAVNRLYLDMYTYVMAHADEVEVMR